MDFVEDLHYKYEGIKHIKCVTNKTANQGSYQGVHLNGRRHENNALVVFLYKKSWK